MYQIKDDIKDIMEGEKNIVDIYQQDVPEIDYESEEEVALKTIVSGLSYRGKIVDSDTDTDTDSDIEPLD